MTLHDLSPWMSPGWHAGAQRVARRTPVLLEMGLATMVITPSESVRRQAIERFRLRPDRVVAIPEAAAPWLGPVAAAGAAAPYFLFVGTLEPRKNLPLLIDAWRLVRRKHPVDLVLAGRRRADCPLLSEEPGLRFLGEAPDEELGALYSGALAFVYPSLYEGFGLPVLEAMQCGCPVITSNTSSLPEVVGDAGLTVNPTSDEELVEAYEKLYYNDELRAEFSKKGLARAKLFSWKKCVDIMVTEILKNAKNQKTKV